MIKKSQSSQSGVALITALLITALVTVAAVAMASRQQLHVHRTANILRGHQAYVYTLGGEAIAASMLKKDDRKVDHYDEDWALGNDAPPIIFESGLLQGRIEDLQGRFNLNNLVNKDGSQNVWNIQRFKKLIDVLSQAKDASDEMKEVNSQELSNALVDWIDADDDVTFSGGAEDSDYLNGVRPYRTANRLMVSSSELLLVRGFSTAVYNAIRPFVTTLPMQTTINVNTAKAEVLRAMGGEALECPNDQGAAKLVRVSPDGQTKAHYESVADYLGKNELGGCKLIGILDKNQNNQGNQNNPSNKPAKQNSNKVFSVKSNFFLVNAYSEVGADDHRSKIELFSVLYRKNDKVEVIMRAQGIY